MKNQNLESIKKQLIETINKKLKDKIIEQSNADLIIKLINGADTVKESVDIAALGTTYKKTGFHFDKRLDKIVNNGSIKYFKKNNELSFSDGSDKPVNKLIIGDNFDALQNLLIQYKNSIDVIYIDPPYGKDSMGQFAETNYNNALTRDNLLSMLYSRLVLAKELLSEDGVIFCSIDDRNQAYVKCLFDEVFGECNFIASVPRKTGAGDAATRSDSELRKPFDYLLIYKKGLETKLKKKVVGEKEYKYNDGLGNYKLDKYQASGSDATKKARPNLYYPIYLLKSNKLTTIKPKEFVKEILPNKINGEDGRWMWKPEKFENENEEYIYYDGNNIYRKTYYNSAEDQNIYQVEKAWIDDSECRNANGTTLLNIILMQKNNFKNPKPVGLIKWCLNLFPNSEAKVLDFFAGSGTTGQAVMELNKEDGGNRQFILCQLNEVTDTTPNGIVIDVTSKRLKRVMTGECYDGNKEFDWIKKNAPLGGSLDVYEIAGVANNESTEGQSPFDVIDETLYGKEKFTNLQDKIEWVCSNFENCQKELIE